MHVAVKSLVEARATVEVTTEDLALDALAPLLHASVESGVRCLMRLAQMSRMSLQMNESDPTVFKTELASCLHLGLLFFHLL